MKNSKGVEMFIIQPRDLLRLTNVSGEELGVAGLLGRLGSTCDILVWGQTFSYCGLYKEWERGRIDVTRMDVRILSVDQVAELNHRGFINALSLRSLTETVLKPKKSVKQDEPEPVVEPVVEPEPVAEPEPEPEPESEPEADPMPKVKKKRTRKKKQKDEE